MEDSTITGMDYNVTWQFKPLSVDKPVQHPVKPKNDETVKEKKA
jgi:hypothetical protein